MGRIYTISFDAVAVTVGIDLFETLAAVGKGFFLHEVVITQVSDYGDAQAEGIRVQLLRGQSGYQSGSGGITTANGVSVGKAREGDAAASFTAECCNTTLALGPTVRFRAEGFNAQVGYQYLPIPEDRFFFAGGEAAIVRMDGASGTAGPTDSLTVSGTMTVEEEG